MSTQVSVCVYMLRVHYSMEGFILKSIQNDNLWYYLLPFCDNIFTSNSLNVSFLERNLPHNVTARCWIGVQHSFNPKRQIIIKYTMSAFKFQPIVKCNWTADTWSLIFGVKWQFVPITDCAFNVLLYVNTLMFISLLTVILSFVRRSARLFYSIITWL